MPNVWCFLFEAQQMVVDWLKGFKVMLAIIILKTCEDFGSIIATKATNVPLDKSSGGFSLMKFHIFLRRINICIYNNCKLLVSHLLCKVFHFVVNVQFGQMICDFFDNQTSWKNSSQVICWSFISFLFLLCNFQSKSNSFLQPSFDCMWT